MTVGAADHALGDLRRQRRPCGADRDQLTNVFRFRFNVVELQDYGVALSTVDTWVPLQILANALSVPLSISEPVPLSACIVVAPIAVVVFTHVLPLTALAIRLGPNAPVSTSVRKVLQFEELSAPWASLPSVKRNHRNSISRLIRQTATACGVKCAAKIHLTAPLRMLAAEMRNGSGFETVNLPAYRRIGASVLPVDAFDHLSLVAKGPR